jgi:pseudouridine-5'-phosphate glycosidase
VTSDATVSGRPIFAAVAVIVVLVSGGIGAIVGASGQERAVAMDLLGVVSFPMTPVSMVAFGMLVTGGVLALLFGLVCVAARYDAETEYDAETDHGE